MLLVVVVVVGQRHRVVWRPALAGWAAVAPAPALLASSRQATAQMAQRIPVVVVVVRKGLEV
jgi:hypothetical protein